MIKENNFLTNNNNDGEKILPAKYKPKQSPNPVAFSGDPQKLTMGEKEKALGRISVGSVARRKTELCSLSPPLSSSIGWFYRNLKLSL